VPIDEWGIHLQEILAGAVRVSRIGISQGFVTQVCADEPERSGGDTNKVWEEFMVPKVCEQTFGEQNAIYPNKERNLNLLRHRNPAEQNENQ
jgi:hypothetical protein